ncbi:MAG: Ezrin/radixin/moesin family protein [Cyclobacteriaceae bacterium]
MKRIVALSVFVLFVAVGFNANAQLSKQEKKEWKKRIKALEPEQFKTLVEENKSLKSQTASLKNELAGVDDKLADKDDQISSLQSQVSKLRDELAEASSKPAQPVNADKGGINESVGVVFKVQIGAYNQKDLSKYGDKAKNFSQETEDGLNKFTVGAFRDYWEADTFKKYLREMGVKDAFIVSYKDGQRVDIKEVLEGVTKS